MRVAISLNQFWTSRTPEQLAAVNSVSMDMCQSPVWERQNETAPICCILNPVDVQHDSVGG